MTENGSSASADEESAPSDDSGVSTGSDGRAGTPGGGPTRVVSSRSVDDILDSLESTPRSGNTGSTGRPDSPADEPVEEAGTAEADDRERPASSTETAERTGTESTTAAAETTLEYDETEDGLSARVEAGTVTGTDVRTAESGDGREAIPDVGEIDLSLDDLETTTPMSRDGSETDASSDAEPSTGLIEPESTSESQEEKESTGLLGRLRALFSR